MPIIKITDEEQKLIIKLVDKIIERKKENPKFDTIELENEIDQIVYDLYQLTKEEIKLIENK